MLLILERNSINLNIDKHLLDIQNIGKSIDVFTCL